MKTEILDELVRFLDKMETKVSKQNTDQLESRKITSQIVSGGLIILFIIAFINGFLLISLSNGLATNLKIVDSLVSSFSGIAGTMNRVTSSVENMSNTLVLMDDINYEMAAIDQDVRLFSKGMQPIEKSVSSIYISMVKVDNTMYKINSQMNRIKHDVYKIDSDMRQVTKPFHFMNKFAPW